MKRVLLVDDDPIIIRLYREGLSRQGFQVETATDGLEALKILRTTRPDVVVLDLMMPRLSGAEVLKFIRSQKDLETLPVVVLSNAYMDPLVRDAAELGALRGLLKVKCNPASLAAAINEVLGGDSTQTGIDHLLAVSKTPPASVATAVAPPSSPLPPITPVTPAPPQPSPESERAEQDSKDQARNEFLSNAPAISSSLRQLFDALNNARNEADRERRLKDFYRRIHFVTAMAGMADYQSVAQMASAFEALLFTMMDQLPRLEPSLERTTSMALEFLQELLSRPPDFRSGPPRNFWALVVDDDRLSNRLVISALRNVQLQVRGAQDSATALRLLQEKQFDLILLDIEMPGMDGIELCKRLRELPGYQSTPVIYVTLHSDFETQAKTVLSGGTDLIAKPILPSELAVKVLMQLLKSPTLN